MGEDLRRRNELEAEMREGISRREFQPYFQPQVHLASGELHGFEVLARWHNPTRGVVEPSEFIAIAEASGLIASLSLSVMRQALSIARDWYAPLTIAINISPVQLKDPLLDQKIAKLLVETGFPAQRLELEITESSLFDDMELALTTIESLKNLGVKLSLDDFGTGYSSLTQLQALPFDRIKIDRSFVMTMNENGESAAIVNAILHLARSLKLPVTAEGIETSAIQGALSELGCADGQGWLYGKALPAQLIEERLPVCDRERTHPSTVETVSGIGQIGSQLHERRDLHRRGTRRKVEKQSARA
jgi:EAL domain-containing protein (putative c-di-GMP-specific phosphodiesterase class I)